MSEKFAEWKERAGNCSDYGAKLRLAKDVADSISAPPHVQTVARQAVRAIEDFLKRGGETQRHTADHRFASLRVELP